MLNPWPLLPLLAALLLCGCSSDPGPSTFGLSGEAKFTGSVRHPVKMALFYTGPLLFDGEPTVAAEDDSVLVSDVADLGETLDLAIAFSLAIDLSAYLSDGDTATLLMWEDSDNDNRPTAGELRSRVFPDLETGCPVFGVSTYFVPAHYTYVARRDPLLDLAKGWNQSYDDWYVSAGDASGAALESEYNFVP
jgi:hypothetical protein